MTLSCRQWRTCSGTLSGDQVVMKTTKTDTMKTIYDNLKIKIFFTVKNPKVTRQNYGKIFVIYFINC